MKTCRYAELDENERATLCRRGAGDPETIRPALETMRTRIADAGDAALRAYTKKLDGVFLEDFRVTDAEIMYAGDQVSSQLKDAIGTAATNIETFHAANMDSGEKVETSQGVICWRETRPIETVGLYIPGGSAPLFSTLLMTAIPARLAGCKNIVICTPPRKDGSVAPEILYPAHLMGLSEIYKIGGAQAIFALAQGTGSIPKAEKIFGPGNTWVTGAKTLVSDTVAIDMPAGPSEVLVIAGKDANPAFVASDLLAQAEHGPDSQAILVTDSGQFAERVNTELEARLSALPRADIARTALANSYILITDSLDQALVFSNRYAPEHLILGFDDYDTYLPKIRNAGSVFCGPLSCESFGDYASGPNHVLPTAGFARAFSGISVSSFQKSISFQQVSKTGCRVLGPVVETLAAAEGLHAHKNAVSVRLAGLGEV